ncbi:MAG: bifunctional non-ous end joining protein LigD, partial [Acidimicrobiia bacterium]|nr:bifunctional non-ous end joining protein LigD [Acidimicrobiia bacterium]
WDEVEAGIDPASLRLPDVLDRPDPWSDHAVAPQRLEQAAAKVQDAGIDLEVISPRARTSAPRTRRTVDLGQSDA